LLAIAVAYAAAFFIRFDLVPPPDHMLGLFFTVPYVAALEFLVTRWLGIHRFVWRYVGLRETVRIGLACVVASLLLCAWRFAIGELHSDYLRRALIPYGVIAINFVLLFLGLSGVRVLRRIQGERRESGQRRPQGSVEPTRTLLVGAGQAGVLVARELMHRPDLGLKAVGFLDDDPNKLGMIIHGIPVVGASKDMPEMCARLRAAQVLITIANAPGGAVRNIRKLAEESGIPVKIIPGLYEIVSGHVNLSRIRSIAIEDLLGREPVALDVEGIGEQVGGRVVMVTGAGGSIGSELCRQLMTFKPSALVLVERG
jgi:FlaA1/EpsC-like NDP-sugar epimerase